MKHQGSWHEPRQYFNNSLCLLCRGWSSVGEYFCHSGKQMYGDGVTYLLVYSRIIFHPSISYLGLSEGDEYPGIFLVMLKGSKVVVLQGVLEMRRWPPQGTTSVQHQLPEGSFIVADFPAAPLLESWSAQIWLMCGPAEQHPCLWLALDPSLALCGVCHYHVSGAAQAELPVFKSATLLTCPSSPYFPSLHLLNIAQPIFFWDHSVHSCL